VEISCVKKRSGRSAAQVRLRAKATGLKKVRYQKYRQWKRGAASKIPAQEERRVQTPKTRGLASPGTMGQALRFGKVGNKQRKV